MNLFSPAEVAKNYINTGKGKVNTPVSKMFLLAILAGAFIAVGGIASTAASVSVEQASVAKFLAGCVFPGGLTMVLLAGSELFTGNNLLVIPLLEKEVTLGGVLKNWVVVYLGNFTQNTADILQQELYLDILHHCLEINLQFLLFLQQLENVP